MTGSDGSGRALQHTGERRSLAEDFDRPLTDMWRRSNRDSADRTDGWTGKNRRAGDEIRTHDNHVGNVVLYQLSYTRGAVPQAVVHRPENGTGTHCL
jgi:hypothetical protein